jgi:AhpD family alkylhydroperoxidase
MLSAQENAKTPTKTLISKIGRKFIILKNPSKVMSQNPFELFSKEFPEIAQKYDQLVDAQRAQKGLDQKTKQLINIAINTAQRNPRGVRFHAMMAKQAGATREEILGAVVMNLHLSGLAAVLDSLPAAIEGLDLKM